MVQSREPHINVRASFTIHKHSQRFLCTSDVELGAFCIERIEELAREVTRSFTDYEAVLMQAKTRCLKRTADNCCTPSTFALHYEHESFRYTGMLPRLSNAVLIDQLKPLKMLTARSTLPPACRSAWTASSLENPISVISLIDSAFPAAT